MGLSVRLIDENGLAHPLGPRTQLGRAPTCQIRIDDPKVSRIHALIIVDDDLITVTDLSTNGTWVNERRIDSPATLKDGDMVRFYTHVFRVVIDSGANAADTSHVDSEEELDPEALADDAIVPPVGEKRAARFGTRFPALFALVALAGVAAVVYFAMFGRVDTTKLDTDLCPDAADIEGQAVLLIDLRTALPEGNAELSRMILADVTRDLGAGTELRVFALAGADQPRELLDRLCKPYNDGDIEVVAKDRLQTAQTDCDDLSAQLSPAVRDAATRFCAHRRDLADRLGRLFGRYGGFGGGGYLMEALEDTLLEFQDYAKPKHLFVFSDMLQHSDWYSHFETGWQDWRFDRFAKIREALNDKLGGPQPSAVGGQIRVFYVPRQNLTAQPRQARAHKQFWEAYFAGADVSFEDQPAMSTYIPPRLPGGSDND